MRKTGFVSLLILFSFTSLFAQLESSENDKEQLAQMEADRFAKLQYANLQITDNQTNYDVRYYDINIQVLPEMTMLAGNVALNADVVNSPVSQIEVNFLDDMQVDSVRVAGRDASFTHSDDLIRVQLDKTYQPGEKVTVRIFYHGTPSQSGYGAFGFDYYAGQPMIWSLSEPFGARNWWPCKDIPADKADSVDMRLTVPQNLVAVSNGLLFSVTSSGDKKIYWWHEKYPIASYLVSVAIHPYAHFSDSVSVVPGSKMPIDYYVYPSELNNAKSAYAKTKRMIEIFSDLFGPYPFYEEKYGHAQFLGGANMEHQTITSLRTYSESTIAHELSHQWWGDNITCHDFGHIWLNEGFATYSEALWKEFYYGKLDYRLNMNAKMYFGDGTIFVSDMSVGNIFNYNRSYRKGSWVLHMLRHVVGDSIFFDILKAYKSDPRYKYGTATTEQFEQVCEAVSGKDLHDFFHQWIYEEYYPQYVFNSSVKDSSGKFVTTVNIYQKQTNTILFHMPVDLLFRFAGGDTVIAVDNFLAEQKYRFVFEQKPVALQLDPENWILKTVREELLQPKFDRGILLVNGVDWQTYGNEIQSLYLDSTLWSDFPISFWDCFQEPGDGYPSSLPQPEGTGRVPSDILGQYSTVIWVGNDYKGDLDAWKNTNISGYLKAGGNVLLFGRHGRSFIDQELEDYLGIQWRESSNNTLANCQSSFAGLSDVSFTGNQNNNAVFDTSFTQAETVLLFKDTKAFSEPRGLGAWRKPAAGGTLRNNGGRFIFISGRPYRFDHTQLRKNAAYILGTFFEENKTPGTGASSQPEAFTLVSNYPNPFKGKTDITFQLIRSADISVSIYNLLGRKIKTLHRGKLRIGKYHFLWNGDDEQSMKIAPGIYFLRIRQNGFIKSIKLVKLK